MMVLAKQYFAYLVKQGVEVQFVWSDDPYEVVSLTFYTNGDIVNQRTMLKEEAREFWKTMKTKRGYAKGVKCSTHLIK